MKNNEIIQEFSRYLKDDGKRPQTIQSYAGDISGFLAYLQQKVTDFNGDLKRFHITSYRNHLVENAYEVTTINKKINSLHAFNRWLIDQGMTTETVIDPRKDRARIASGSEKQVEVLTEKQLERLLFCVQGGKVRIRDRAIVLTLYTGVRVGELCNIRLKHLDLLTHQLKVIGKGGKIREVPLRAEVVEAIQAYLPIRVKQPYGQSPYLFLGQRGPLQRDAVNTLLEKMTVKADLDVRLKPHTFRHTFCTQLVKKGVPLTVISKLAGHSSVDTTAHFYINSSKEDKLRAVNTL